MNTANPSRVVPLLVFLARRLVFGALALLGATYLAYQIVRNLAWSQTGAAVAGLQPYGTWLRRAIVGDFGYSMNNTRILDDIATAIPQTLWLVGGAAALSVTFGVLAGIVAAIRQYSKLDYTITTLSFVFFSVPPFLAAILGKHWLAIRFNDTLSGFARNPVIPWGWLIIASVVAGAFWSSLLAGSLRTRWLTFGIGAAATLAGLAVGLSTGWLLYPRLGLVGVVLIGTAIAFGSVIITTGVLERRALYAALAMVLLAGLLYVPLQFLFVSPLIGWPLIALLGLAAWLVAMATGWLFGGKTRTRRHSMTAASITALSTAGLILVDRFLAVWPHFLALRWVNYRPIPTIASGRPGIPNDFWFFNLDNWTRLWVPTIALSLISFASYLRYTRASLTETISQDYVRTARAKGIPEYLVVIRHALRNALLPLATIVPQDLAGLIGGAILVERSFAIAGMGDFYLNAVRGPTDWWPIFVSFPELMAYIVVTGAILILVNLVADLIYAALDPRIKLL